MQAPPILLFTIEAKAIFCFFGGHQKQKQLLCSFGGHQNHCMFPLLLWLRLRANSIQDNQTSKEAKDQSGFLLLCYFGCWAGSNEPNKQSNGKSNANSNGNSNKKAKKQANKQLSISKMHKAILHPPLFAFLPLCK